MHQLTPDPELFNRITSQIAYEQALLKLKRRLFLWYLSLSGSLAAFSLAYRDFVKQITETGFLQFLNLFLSDFKAVSNHLFDYLLSLTEALPIISFALVSLTALFVLFTGVKLLRYSFQFKHLKIG